MNNLVEMDIIGYLVLKQVAKLPLESLESEKSLHSCIKEYLSSCVVEDD